MHFVEAPWGSKRGTKAQITSLCFQSQLITKIACGKWVEAHSIAGAAEFTLCYVLIQVYQLGRSHVLALLPQIGWAAAGRSLTWRPHLLLWINGGGFSICLLLPCRQPVQNQRRGTRHFSFRVFSPNSLSWDDVLTDEVTDTGWAEAEKLNKLKEAARIYPATGGLTRTNKKRGIWGSIRRDDRPPRRSLLFLTTDVNLTSVQTQLV